MKNQFRDDKPLKRQQSGTRSEWAHVIRAAIREALTLEKPCPDCYGTGNNFCRTCYTNGPRPGYLYTDFGQEIVDLIRAEFARISERDPDD